jgi:cation diffusion facilitator CzcD-associated flavoprotein CzcO
MDARVTIVGAGPAGLSVARELQRWGVRPVVLERGRVGETWARQYRDLHLHALPSASSLPGLRWRGTRERFPSASEMVAYLRAYAKRFDVEVREGVTVEIAEPDRCVGVVAGSAERSVVWSSGLTTDRRREPHAAANGWRLRTDRGTWRTERLVMATGIWSAPYEPPLPGREAFRGRALHVSAYCGPDELAGARVLVVGLGNSGKDVAVAAARSGGNVSVAVRDGVAFVRYPNALTQHAGGLWRRLPPGLVEVLLRRVRPAPHLPGLPALERPLASVFPVVGLELVEEVRRGHVRLRPAMAGFTEVGARFADGSEDAFDVIVLCTGYRPALAPVAEHLGWGVDGRPLTDEGGCRALGSPGLYLVGYRYPALETYLQQLRREAPAAAGAIATDIRAAAAAPVSA